MDLYKEWDTLNKTKFNTTLTNKEIMEALTQQSHSSLATLKNRLKQNIYWALGFTTINLIWILFSLNKGELLGLLSILFVMHVIYLSVTITNYRKVQAGVAFGSDVTSAIKSNYQILKNTLSFTQNWGLFAIPMSVVTASLVVNYYFGHTVAEYFNNAHKLTSLLIYIIVLVPLAIKGGSMANKKTFGDQLEQLQKYIIQLETLEEKYTQPI
ncbi:MAG: hypothetical protein V4619_12455 [Bacteroidota bacterium]